jgi:hypothetical protein
MSAKSLLESNPYLADPKLRAKMIHASVVTSTAIEGVHIKMRSKRISVRKKK